MFSSAAVDCNPSSTEGHVRTTLTTRRDFCRTIQHAIPLATASCERGAQGRRPHPHAPMVSRKPQIRFVAHAAGAVGRHECCWSRVRHECCWSRVRHECCWSRVRRECCWSRVRREGCLSLADKAAQLQGHGSECRGGNRRRRKALSPRLNSAFARSPLRPPCGREPPHAGASTDWDRCGPRSVSEIFQHAPNVGARTAPCTR